MMIDIEPYYLDSVSLEKERIPDFLQRSSAGYPPPDAGVDRPTRFAPLWIPLAALAGFGARLAPRSLLRTAWRIASRPEDGREWWTDQYGHRWNADDIAEASAAGYLRLAVADEHAGAAVYATSRGVPLYLVRHSPPVGSASDAHHADDLRKPPK